MNNTSQIANSPREFFRAAWNKARWYVQSGDLGTYRGQYHEYDTSLTRALFRRALRVVVNQYQQAKAATTEFDISCDF